MCAVHAIPVRVQRCLLAMMHAGRAGITVGVRRRVLARDALRLSLALSQQRVEVRLQSIISDLPILSLLRRILQLLLCQSMNNLARAALWYAWPLMPVHCYAWLCSQIVTPVHYMCVR